ncbi:hypothetical protein COMNV_01744 [Commensalibacter sp. Nvir]|uniref:lytic transglycosylase domain-containing protein n=1 Tax=Commensalibacter sp. Nvir TaxID=3069817 RepID=UPI002D2CA0B3|nr:hypothetical protein COMNV_01744 [Commensalibacter sp. Nvir]
MSRCENHRKLPLFGLLYSHTLRLNIQYLYNNFLKYGLLPSLVLFISACSSSSYRQQIPIAQEVANYKARAKSYYAPPGPPGDPWGPYIYEASRRFDVPDAWIRAVMKQESGGNLYVNGQLVTSGPGAMGLMQLMPPTYDEMRIAYNLGDDAYDPHDNIMAGTAYIRQMYDIYGSPGFLAAYNGGPGRLDDFLTRNRSLPLETRRYVASIGFQIQGITPLRRSQADLLVESHQNNTNLDPEIYASAAQPQSAFYTKRNFSGQALEVQQAWSNKRNNSSATDSLNYASLNRMDDATTEALNRQSLQSKQQATTQVAMLASSSSNTTTYPTRWKRFDQSRRTSFINTSTVASTWASRGYSVANRNQTSKQITSSSRRNLEPPIILTSASANQYRAIRKPISYQLVSVPERNNFNRSSKHKLKSFEYEKNVSSVGQWGIQVGAFVSSSQAHTAVAKAKTHAALKLGNQQIQAVRVGKNKLYRARVTGLSQATARAACQKLSSCMLLSPSKISS